MIKSTDIEKLARLARIAVDSNEVPNLIKDMNSIVDYISILSKVEVGDVPAIIPTSGLLNVVREDNNAHEKGAYTEALLAEAPVVVNGFVSVKPIFNND